MAEITDNMNSKTSKKVQYGTYSAGLLFHSASSLFFILLGSIKLMSTGKY